MNRINQRFDELRGAGRKALIPYITAGDPDPAETLPLMHAMVMAGADIIELGVPFSDPMADGPVIQRASERALVHHVSLRNVINMVRKFRREDRDTPVVLMGYLNPIEVMGYDVFIEEATEAGLDGVLTVDLPPEEAGEWLSVLDNAALAPIFLIAPTTSRERIKMICEVARGFIYYVSLKGVTGAKNFDITTVKKKLQQVRQATSLPIGVGFGINEAAAAAQLAEVADAVVVGSVLVQKIEEHLGDKQKVVQEISAILSLMRAAMDEKAVVR